MNSLLQGANNEPHTSRNCAVVKSPKVSSFETLITKQNTFVKIENKSHFHISLSFMSLSKYLVYCLAFSVTDKETWEKEVFTSDLIRHGRECSSLFSTFIH